MKGGGGSKGRFVASYSCRSTSREVATRRFIYLIAVRILLNESKFVYFFRTTSSSSFFFLLSSSSLFRRFLRPPTGQRDLRVVVLRSISSKRVVNGRNDVHDDERVRV